MNEFARRCPPEESAQVWFSLSPGAARYTLWRITVSLGWNCPDVLTSLNKLRLFVVFLSFLLFLLHCVYNKLVWKLLRADVSLCHADVTKLKALEHWTSGLCLISRTHKRTQFPICSDGELQNSLLEFPPTFLGIRWGKRPQTWLRFKLRKRIKVEACAWLVLCVFLNQTRSQQEHRKLCLPGWLGDA